jgi:hypothetical protein
MAPAISAMSALIFQRGFGNRFHNRVCYGRSQGDLLCSAEAICFFNSALACQAVASRPAVVLREGWLAKAGHLSLVTLLELHPRFLFLTTSCFLILSSLHSLFNGR